MMVRRNRYWYGHLMALAAFASFMCQTDAVQGKPLTFTQLTLQTTRTVEHEGIETGRVGVARIVENVPTTTTQAGDHLNGVNGDADGLTIKGVFETEEHTYKNAGGEVIKVVGPTRDPKDIVVALPEGLLGDPLAVPRCSLTHLLRTLEHCPADTQVGIMRLREANDSESLSPVVNVTPEAGQSLEFAVETVTKIVFLETAHLVRSASTHQYEFTVSSNDIPMAANLQSFEQTVWGVPADPGHDPFRGLYCHTNGGLPLCPTSERGIPGVGGGEPSDVVPVPFLTLPTHCTGGPETTVVRADSWEEPGHVGENQRYEGYLEKAVESPLPTVVGGPSAGFTGCQSLAFDPSIEVQPDSLLADSPIGLGVTVNVPQPEQPEVLGTPHLRDASVTLPLGVSVSPGVVDGVQACKEEGPEGINIEGPLSERPGPNGELQLAPGRCPGDSTVGTAEAITPLLPEPVRGHVYLAEPRCGGASQPSCTEADAANGTLYRLYLELGGEGALANAGIEIKALGEASIDTATGQITARFREDPQTPFSKLVVHLNGGPRASLASPAACGIATTTSDFTPWSAPGLTPAGLLVAGTADATPSSSFAVEPGGCPPTWPFAPGFNGGTAIPQAGQFSAFTMSLSRKDREQYIKGIQLHTPPGLLAMISSVPLCPEGQAEDPGSYGECGASKIGTVRVASGAGSHPFEIEGSVYLTGPYDGAPFGLSIVTNAVAGPFNLGLIVVRAKIDIDSRDATATITADETGAHAVPQAIFGVPLRLQRITVDIDRPGFMFNPTSCATKQVTARVSGSQTAVVGVSSPFAVQGCGGLGFKPTFTASTSARTSRANGASLYARLSYPVGAMGNDANIARVKVSLPKRLPSRLTTLQQACPAKTFAENPALCPKGSVVGIARTSTPLLSAPLQGPVYFVSHGGEAFPNLVIVLQGEGIRVNLVGDTFISKSSITSTTFNAVPDVPVRSFEIYLPEGRYSALAANGTLCATTKVVEVKKKIRHIQRSGNLVMPVEFTAQNGTVLRRSVKIAVDGCGLRAKHTKRAGRKPVVGGRGK